MDPLYSYSMGIVPQFPQSFIYYCHYLSCCNHIEADFSVILWLKIRTLHFFEVPFRLFTMWIILWEQWTTCSSFPKQNDQWHFIAVALLWWSERLCDLNSHTITWKGSQEWIGLAWPWAHTSMSSKAVASRFTTPQVIHLLQAVG